MELAHTQILEDARLTVRYQSINHSHGGSAILALGGDAVEELVACDPASDVETLILRMKNIQICLNLICKY